MSLPKPYYEQDGITIYHADCADVLPMVDPAGVALVVTDPPYGINLDTRNARRQRGSTVARPYRVIDHPYVEGDDKMFDPRPLLRYQRLILFGANNYTEWLPPSTAWLVWDRRSGESRTADAELAWTNLGGTVRMFSHLWNGYNRDSEIGFHVHPTQKPVALFRWILDRWTKPSDLILDPYMGSGPIAQACFEMGRRYIGVETVKDYCRIAADRLAQRVLV